MVTIMQFIRCSASPAYLRCRELYRTLIENDGDPDEELTFPVSVLKPNVTVCCVEDCDHLLNSLRFWVVLDFIPRELVDFVLSACGACSEVLLRFEEELGYLQPLRLMTSTAGVNKIILAIGSGKVELVEGAARKLNFFPSDACNLAVAAGSVEVMKYLHVHDDNPCKAKLR